MCNGWAMLQQFDRLAWRSLPPEAAQELEAIIHKMAQAHPRESIQELDAFAVRHDYIERDAFRLGGGPAQ